MDVQGFGQVHHQLFALGRIDFHIAAEASKHLGNPFRLIFTLFCEPLLEHVAKLDFFVLRRGTGATEYLVAVGRKFRVDADEVLEDVVNVPFDFQAHLDFSFDAV